MRQQLKDFIIAFDFDGTIVSNNWPNIGKPNNDMISAIRYLHSYGCIITIWTCREEQSLQEAIDFMNANKIPFDIINDNPKYIVDTFGINSRKIYADIYVDDKAVEGIPDSSTIVSQVYVRYPQKIHASTYVAPNKIEV